MKSPVINIITNDTQSVLMTITTTYTSLSAIIKISIKVINVLDNTNNIKYDGDNLSDAIKEFNFQNNLNKNI